MADTKKKKKKVLKTNQVCRYIPEEESADEAYHRRKEEIESYGRRYSDKHFRSTWYPLRHSLKEVEHIRYITRGKYRRGWPQGCVIHWTAGRSRGIDLAGPKRGKSAEHHAINSVKYCHRTNIATYLLIDRVGNVYQNHPIDEWGYHAGKSHWHKLGTSVSKDLVGIEVMNAGKLKPIEEPDKVAWEEYNGMELPEGNWYKAWFTRPRNGDWFFSESEVRYGRDKENCYEGHYHRFTDAQETALFYLIKWLYMEGEGLFDLDLVLGHDSVAKPKGRKVDPGWSFSMTIPEFQEKLKSSI